LTITFILSVLPFAVAEIVVVPLATALTTPLLLTVAMDFALVFHVTALVELDGVSAVPKVNVSPTLTVIVSKTAVAALVSVETKEVVSLHSVPSSLPESLVSLM
jgi:hypothetical protein